MKIAYVWYNSKEKSLVKSILAREKSDWSVTCIPETSVSTLTAVLDLLAVGYDAILVHLSLPHCLALKMAEIVHRESRSPKIILFSRSKADPTAIHALFDGHLHPDRDMGKIAGIVAAIIAKDRVSLADQQLQDAIVSIFNSDSVVKAAFLKQWELRYKDHVTFEDYQYAVNASVPPDTADSVSSSAAECEVFISYAGADSATALEVKDSLGKHGIRCFMAGRDIAGGNTWEADIRDAIACAKEVLIVLTPQSIHRQWVMIEAGAAWVLRKRITPCIAYANLDEIPEPIARHQARTIVTQKDKETLVDEIRVRLRGHTHG